MTGEMTPSGVRLAATFRSNLIIDRYDPAFARMRASKRKHMRSENSEDVLTWNVFRSLRQVQPELWLPVLASAAKPSLPLDPSDEVTIRLWESVAPPLSLLGGGDEGESEIDIVVESPTWVWFIEAKYRSDISEGTTTRPDRDQILRNLDVGSSYAGVRPFHFSLLVHSEERSRVGVEKVREYQDFALVRRQLGHRRDGLGNLMAVSLLAWQDCGRTLGAVAEAGSARSEERAVANHALKWLRGKGIGG